MLRSVHVLVPVHVLVLALSACGTYTHVRAADNLPRGRVELAAGLAANAFGEVLPVVAGAIGATDWLELEAQYEVYSALAEARFAVLGSDRDALALAIGIGGGAATVWVVEDESRSDAALLADVVVGKRWRSLDVFLADKLIYMLDPGYVLNAARAGVRGHIGRLILGVEGGATFHHDFLVLGEASVLIGVSL